MAFPLKFIPATSFLVVFSLSTALPFTSSQLGLLKETHLHLYFHEINAGPNATVAAVAGPVDPSTLFGLVAVVDEYLREGPELTSNVIGRAQGTTAGASQAEVAYVVAVNFVFTEGKFNGSTLALFGRAVFESSTREWSIIGGTGQFRLARGYAVGKRLDSPAGTLLIEFDLYFSHCGLSAAVF